MFTGIIEDIATVKAAGSAKLTITTRLDDIRTGDSVAVNGVCLTATSIAGSNGALTIAFDYSPETASRTNLGELSADSCVNIERALKVGDRLGGHFLTGHIQETGKLEHIRQQGEFVVLNFSCSADFSRYLVDKGSVGIDGISLTVVEPGERSFSAAVIPHTIEQTCLRFRKPGSVVNIEPDLIAKYVENILSKRNERKPLTAEFLKQNGF
jgi:riboflavin synthase